ncbi:MAG: hypothetical protein JNM58_17500 [Xanthomonadaceae bacterium]|nr:hypothetical protein [Xanthomonadaceae bacterium]
MTKLKWHPSLKKTFKGCEVWWQSNMVKRDERNTRLAELTDTLSQEGRFRGANLSTLMTLAQNYCIEACLLGQKNEVAAVAQPLWFGVRFRALDFIIPATRALPSMHSQPLLPFKSSLMAVGPTMLSDWALGRQCAYYLIQVAHKDMRMNVPAIRKEGWGKGTNDAFLIGLLSRAYGIPTHYEPAKPMIDVYRRLLDVWQSIDQEAFRVAMAEAADFHISRSKGSTDRIWYEFESYYDSVYPSELLAVQALRRRVGLPEFETGHLLIDTPWSIIRDMPACEPHPLAISLEQRLRKDDPECWAVDSDE